MAPTSNPVLQALSRWQTKGLLSDDVAAALREEVEEQLQEEGRRWSQYLLAATGGAVLIIAGATFLAWAWPELGLAGQSLALGVIGFLLLGLGIWLPAEGRWVPGALLQVCGPVLVLMALFHSEGAWPDGTLGGVVSGSIGLVIPLALVAVALRRDVGLAAVQASLGFLFLFTFFDRALALEAETVVWILDVVLVVGLVYLGRRLRNPKGPAWVLPLFASFVFTTPFLLGFSGDLLWGLDDYTVIPIDVWLVVVAGLSCWALQKGALPHLRREWYEQVLALCVLVAIPLGFFTTLEALHTGPAAAALTVGGAGALGLWLGLSRGSRPVVATACVALLVAAWYYGVEKAGALGAVVALAIMAGVLFWGSSRIYRRAPADRSARVRA